MAGRVVRACEAVGAESVAVFSEADQRAPHVQHATRAVALPGLTAAETYLNQDALIAIALAEGCDAVHPGYGFLSENAEFADALAAKGIAFVGPSANQLRQFGDKVAARRAFADTGFPMHAGSEPVKDVDAAVTQARTMGYPVMLKPSHGGGGIGMVRATGDEELVASFGRAQALAQSAFGEGDLYLERWIERARHVEFQVLADQRGNALHLFERDCSLQRRHQKVIEEAPAPGVDRAVVDGVAAQAVVSMQGQGYDHIGTLETLLAADGSYGFLEVNPRLQVEHAVTEMVTGIDIVATQLRLASGGPLPVPSGLSGHAIEVRLYAEDSVRCLPSTGVLSRFELPELHGVRFEPGYAAGQPVTPYYDPMLGKIIAHGANRELAIGRCLVALRALEIEGVETNVALLVRLLESQAFVRGDVHTGLIDELMSGGQLGAV